MGHTLCVSKAGSRKVVADARVLVVAILLAFSAPAAAGDLEGSKHDLTAANRLAGVASMGGYAYNDYRDPCVYCHIPKDGSGAPDHGSGTARWNRSLGSSKDYQLYDSPTLQSKIKELGEESLLCLSCHDGTMAVDMIVQAPANWGTSEASSLHMRLDAGGGLDRCGQCHNGVTAHRMDRVVIGRNLMTGHPVGATYPDPFQDEYKRAINGVFRNGVRLFRNKVECASCHNVHKPDIFPFLRTKQSELCTTCHNK